MPPTRSLDPFHPDAPSARREVVGDTPPDVSAAARRVVLRRYERGSLSADEAAVTLAMLGLGPNEAGWSAADRLRAYVAASEAQATPGHPPDAPDAPTADSGPGTDPSEEFVPSPRFKPLHPGGPPMCMKGLHPATRANIYTRADGKSECRPCRAAGDRRKRNRTRGRGVA